MLIDKIQAPAIGNLDPGKNLEPAVRVKTAFPEMQARVLFAAEIDRRSWNLRAQPLS